ncbi:DNA polymerase III subunit delta' [Castellaniella sp.]|uniref:DNA polymerase III subunit delta' n=1 Tax=Castellaniella sp. TaxID=1955812 RepID=UPI0035678800
MFTQSFLPWQEETARRWLSERERFAHAWLIHGQRGTGQLHFAQAGAAALLCEHPTDGGMACGRCQACRWVQAGNHPDLRRIRPDAIALEEGEEINADNKKQASRDIRIDQLRALLPWFNLATHRGGWRVALLYPADTLNPTAANALLKTLEEPPERTAFLLVCDAPDRLLPTLVSRCRRLHLQAPKPTQALEWLQARGAAQAAERLAASGGAPLLALDMATGAVVPEFLQMFLSRAGRQDDGSALAHALSTQDTLVWVDAFQRLWLDIRLAAHGIQARYYPSMQTELTQAADRLDPQAWADVARWLVEQRRLARHPLNTGLQAAHAATRLLCAFRS